MDDMAHPFQKYIMGQYFRREMNAEDTATTDWLG
jgi:hypothetical protein